VAVIGLAAGVGCGLLGGIGIGIGIGIEADSDGLVVAALSGMGDVGQDPASAAVGSPPRGSGSCLRR